MKISLLGPTNLKKLAEITGITSEQIETAAKEVANAIAASGELQMVFDLNGILELVANEYKSAGGKLTLLYTENDYDWETKPYMHFLEQADETIQLDSWHDMLLHLVKNTDVVVCAGLSSGVWAELAYIKWNHVEGKCNLKAIVGIKNLLRNGEFPPELSHELQDKIIYTDAANLSEKLAQLND